MKVKTAVLQSMLNTAVKASSCNKLMPLTSLVCIEQRNNELRVITTDTNNYLYIRKQNESDDFYVTVMIETFYKLISKLTCEYTTLEVKNDTLEITGNGKYTIEIPLDENGEVIQYPDPLSEVDEIAETDVIDYSDVATIISKVKTSVANTVEVPILTNYYVGDTVTASDQYNIASYQKQMLSSNHVISVETMNLIALLTQDKINVSVADTYVVYKTDDAILYSKITDDADSYPIEAIDNLVKETYDNSCIVDRAKLLEALDRISLFTSEYDNRAVTVEFSADGVTVANTGNSSNELITYADDLTERSEFSCNIPIVALIEHIKSCTNEHIEIQYGADNAIKIIDGDVIMVVALCA